MTEDKFIRIRKATSYSRKKRQSAEIKEELRNEQYDTIEREIQLALRDYQDMFYK